MSQTPTTPPTTDDNQIVQIIEIGGKKVEVRGKVNLEFREIPLPPIPDPEPPIDPTDPVLSEPPKEGHLKHGGWGASLDPKTWIRTNMKNPPEEFKITDGKFNVAHHFKTAELADAFIKYFQRHPEKIPEYFDVIEEPGTPTTPTEPPGPVTPGVDEVEGIKLPHKTNGKIKTSGWKHNPNDGLRVDYNDQSEADFENNIAICVAKFKGNVTKNQERCFKWTWGTHSGSSSQADCYIVLSRNGDGKTRVRFEATHPSGYSDLQKYGEGLADGQPAQPGKLWALMGVRQNLVNKEGKVTGVRLQLFEDFGPIKEDGTLANNWKQLIEFVDTKKMITDYSEHGIDITCRMDDDIGDKNIDVKRYVLVGIQPGQAA